MHGIIGSFIAKPGTRDALVALLQESARSMPGCLSYVISTDPENPDAVWVTEAWESAEAHKASLSLPAVRAAISEAMPLIAGFGERRVLTPVAVFTGPAA